LFIIILPIKKNEDKTTNHDTISQILFIHHIILCFKLLL
jgi:hypothetical protein